MNPLLFLDYIHFIYPNNIEFKQLFKQLINQHLL